MVPVIYFADWHLFIAQVFVGWLESTRTLWLLTYPLGLFGFYSPFNGLLAEAVERHLTGKPPHPFRWRYLLANIGYLSSPWYQELTWALRSQPVNATPLGVYQRVKPSRGFFSVAD